ncbi:MAG: pilus assembly protein [Dehalococcoidia bacterium]|nr:pilus assembly protein [Dehalococcoidia bacterium]
MLKLIRARRKNGEKGQALVEFTLLVPIFLLLLFAIVDFGMGFYSWITVTNSAREGARLGAVHAPLNVPSSPCYLKASLDQCIEDRVRATADRLDQSNMIVTITGEEGPPGDSVVVTVDYEYDLITPLAGIVSFVTGSNTFGSTLNLPSSADMRLE